MTTSDKASTTEQLSLVFELYHRIPQGRKVTATELQLELSNAGIHRGIRSIQRNLDVIVNYFDVEKDTRGKPYGYRRRTPFFATLGARELILLQLAKSMLNQHFPPSLQYAIDSAFNILEIQPRSYTGTKPPQGGANKIQSISDKLNHAKIIEKHFEPIAVALAQQKQITLTLSSGIAIKQASPIGLTMTAGELYLIYQNHLNEYDDLPLQQIEELKVLTFHFDYPSDFQLQRYQLKSKLTFSTPSQANNVTSITASDRQ